MWIVLGSLAYCIFCDCSAFRETTGADLQIAEFSEGAFHVLVDALIVVVRRSEWLVGVEQVCKYLLKSLGEFFLVGFDIGYRYVTNTQSRTVLVCYFLLDEEQTG